jgi:hypothetical protein
LNRGWSFSRPESIEQVIPHTLLQQ